jgi:hypothetical protein
MANKTSRGKRLGVTPAKLIMIGVLSVVLAAVVYAQFGSSPAVVATTGATRPLPRRAAVVPQPPTEAKFEQLPATHPTSSKIDLSSDWQSADLAKAVMYDPFALPASFPQRLKAGEEDKLARETVKTEDAKAEEAARADAIKAMQTQFTQLQHDGVRVVMQKNDKYVALVGDRTIHVGDVIEGFTVVAIDSEGVRVARDLKQ